MYKDAHFLACAIIAFTRKHLNLAVVWPCELEILCMCQLDNIKDLYELLATKYRESFPEHAINQERLVQGRQVLYKLPVSEP